MDLSSPRVFPVSRRSALLGAGATALLSLPTPALAADLDVFSPAAGSLAGVTIFITGCNVGLGLESAKRLGAAGADVIVTARTKEKVDAAVAAITESQPAGKVVGIELDLANLTSVKSLPRRLEAAVGTSPVIDVLMNNAGVMGVPERVTTVDGLEKTIGINHLGHFALTGALLPNLRKAKNGFRIVNVASEAFRTADKEMITTALDAKLDPADRGNFGMGIYSVSKACNVIFTAELNRRFEAAGIKGSAVVGHTFLSQTDLIRYFVGGSKADDYHPTDVPKPTGIGKWFKETFLDKSGIVPIEQGASTQVYLAAAADTGGDRSRRGGLTFLYMQPSEPTDAVTDIELGKKVWSVSEELTGTKIAF